MAEMKGPFESVTVDPAPNAGGQAAIERQHERLHCRMYEAKFPKVDSVVMVNVKQIADIGKQISL
jgi:hypothetical protein